MPSREEVIEIVKRCYDPEIPINIYDLGLIYEIDAKPDSVFVKMSLTAASCPAASPCRSRCGRKSAQGRGSKRWRSP